MTMQNVTDSVTAARGGTAAPANPTARRSGRSAPLGRLTYAAVLVVILAFVALPLLVVVWTSIQPDRFPQVPPNGLSVQWWREALTETWLAPIRLSLLIGLAAGAIATVLGTVASYGLHKSKGRLRAAYDSFLLSPLLLPEIVLGVAILQFLADADLRDALGAPILIITHSVVGIPFVMRTVGVSLGGVRPEWEDAARDLGASRRKALLVVTLPLARGGILAGFLFAFVQSFNNVELSLFLNERGNETIPIALLTFMEFEYSPSLAAVAILNVAIVVVLVVIFGKYLNLKQLTK